MPKLPNKNSDRNTGGLPRWRTATTPKTEPLNERPWYKTSVAAVALGTAVVTLFAGILAFYRSLPAEEPIDTATEFVLDASDSLNEYVLGVPGDKVVAQSIEAALATTSTADHLAMRTFGGACTSRGTTLLTPFRADAKDLILAKWSAIRGAGSRPLALGMIEAVGDFSQPRIRQSKKKRIIVVTTGDDDCGHLYGSPDNTYAIVGNRLKESGIQVDFFVIGYGVPAQRRAQLTTLTVGLGGTVSFPENQSQLVAALKSATTGKKIVDFSLGSTSPPASASSSVNSPTAAQVTQGPPPSANAAIAPLDERLKRLLSVASLSSDVHTQVSRLFTSLEMIRSSDTSTASNYPAMWIGAQLRELESNEGLEFFIINGEPPRNVESVLRKIEYFYDERYIKTTPEDRLAILNALIESQKKYYKTIFAHKLALTPAKADRPNSAFVDRLYEQIVVLNLGRALLDRHADQSDTITASASQEAILKVVQILPYRVESNTVDAMTIRGWILGSIQRNAGQVRWLVNKVQDASTEQLLPVFIEQASRGSPRAAFEAAEILSKTRSIRGDPQIYLLYRQAALARIPAAQNRLLSAGLDPYN